MFRNSKPSHLVERPCRKCHISTKALDVRTGRMEDHPLCPKCRSEFAAQWQRADAQRKRASIAKGA